MDRLFVVLVDAALMMMMQLKRRLNNNNTTVDDDIDCPLVEIISLPPIIVLLGLSVRKLCVLVREARSGARWR